MEKSTIFALENGEKPTNTYRCGKIKKHYMLRFGIDNATRYGV